MAKIVQFKDVTIVLRHIAVVTRNDEMETEGDTLVRNWYLKISFIGETHVTVCFATKEVRDIQYDRIIRGINSWLR